VPRIVLGDRVNRQSLRHHQSLQHAAAAPSPLSSTTKSASKSGQAGREFGSTTGRPPRCTGWIDLPALRYAIMLNGVTELFHLMKADVSMVYRN
jgi:adenylosuccinate synthase